MPSFNKTSDPRPSRPPRESGDYVPLLRVRRGSRNQNIWNDNEDRNTTAAHNNLRGRRSSEVFDRFLDDGEDEEDTSRLSRESGVFHDPDSRSGLDKTDTEGLIAPRSVSLSCLNN